MYGKLLENLLPTLGEAGVEALRSELDDLAAEAQEPWKRSVLALVANGVEQFGPEGVAVATTAISRLLEGNEAPDINWADLDVASDILAHMQNAEADRKSDAEEFLTRVGRVLGVIFGGILKGLIASV